jgi:hypothetical protein
LARLQRRLTQQRQQQQDSAAQRHDEPDVSVTKARAQSSRKHSLARASATAAQLSASEEDIQTSRCVANSQ